MTMGFTSTLPFHAMSRSLQGAHFTVPARRQVCGVVTLIPPSSRLLRFACPIRSAILYTMSLAKATDESAQGMAHLKKGSPG